jgi:hypothetical protein
MIAQIHCRVISTQEPLMKKAIIILYALFAIQSIIIIISFVFTFASMRKAFEYAGAELIKITDARYVLKSNP